MYIAFTWPLLLDSSRMSVLTQYISVKIQSCLRIQVKRYRFCTITNQHYGQTLCKKATIHQVTTMLTTSKNVLFTGHNHLLTTSADDPSLSRWCSFDNQSVRSSAPVVSRWLWPGNRTFLEVASVVVTWWIMAFLHTERFLSFVFLLNLLKFCCCFMILCYIWLQYQSFN